MVLKDTQKTQEGRFDDDAGKFTHVGVAKPTQKKIALLARFHPSGKIYKMVDEWVEQYWTQAKEAGMVTDAMLQPNAHWVARGTSKPKKLRREGV
jgi:hypothetical protein